MSRRDLLRLLTLVLLVVCGVQYLRYRVQLDSVGKTVAALIPQWHQGGERVFRDSLSDQLELMGLVVSADDIETSEDRIHDEIKVVVHYSWPLDVLLWELPRRHVFELESPYYEL